MGTEIRKINRIIPCPQLDTASFEAVESICFGPRHDLGESDLIFAFGTSHGVKELASSIATLVRAKIANVVLITGGIPNYADSTPRSESEADEIIRELAKLIDLNAIRVLPETKATHLGENVMFSLPILKEIPHKNITFISKPHGHGRAEATLRKYIPESNLQGTSYPVDFGTGFLTRETWRGSPQHRDRVWGEFLRIEHYSRLKEVVLSDEQQQILHTLKKVMKD